MGFFSNMFDAAGTKTGKAITNKLFGKYANDLNVGMSLSASEASDDQVKIEREHTKRMLKEAEIEDRRIEQQREDAKSERMDALHDELISYQLDMNNVSGLTQSLSYLSSIVDSYSDDWKAKKVVAVAKTKFELGLTMLKKTSERDMIAFFEAKKKDWEMRQREQELQRKNAMKNLLKIGIGMLVLLIIVAVLALVFG